MIMNDGIRHACIHPARACRQTVYSALLYLLRATNLACPIHRHLEMDRIDRGVGHKQCYVCVRALWLIDGERTVFFRENEASRGARLNGPRGRCR